MRQGDKMSRGQSLEHLSGQLCLMPTMQAANNQYSTSLTQHGHHTQMGVRTLGIERLAHGTGPD